MRGRRRRRAGAGAGLAGGIAGVWPVVAGPGLAGWGTAPPGAVDAGFCPDMRSSTVVGAALVCEPT